MQAKKSLGQHWLVLKDNLRFSFNAQSAKPTLAGKLGYYLSLRRYIND